MALSFGDFVLDERERSLSGPRGAIELSARSIDMLFVFLERPNVLVEKRELFDLLWPGTIVEENTLHVHMSALRKALGPNFVATVHGRGYRYVGPLPTLIHERTTPVTRSAGNLSLYRPECIARDPEIRGLMELVGQYQLVTILGAGGVGKTTLALKAAEELARDFQGGVWVVDLASVPDGSFVASAIMQVLGIPVRTDTTPLLAILDMLRPLAGLLVLDNCEHVAHAVANVVRSLLPDATMLRIVTTSQVPLGLSGEHIFKLAPFAVEATSESGSSAAETFLIHCYEARGETLSTDELPLVRQLCVRLGGVALALKMVAARSATLGLAEIDRQLAERMGELSTGWGDTVGRHRSLAASLEWSYGLLAEGERRALRALAVFQGSFVLDGVRAVVGEHADAHLSELVRRSLIARDSGDRARYRLLETTRHFALQELARQNEEQDARARLADHVLSRFEESLARWELIPDAAWVAVYRPDTDNLRSALEWARSRADWSLFVGLAAVSYRYWIEAQLAGEGFRFAEAAVAFADDVGPRLRARLLLAVGELARINSRDLRATEALARAVEQFDADADDRLLAQALVLLGTTLNFAGRRSEAAPVFARLEALSGRLAPSKLKAWSLVSLGLWLLTSGEDVAGMAKCQAGLAMHRSCGNERGLFRSTLYLAEIIHRKQDHKGALALAEGILPSLRERGSSIELGAQLSNLACYFLALGNSEAARDATTEAWKYLPRDHASWHWCIIQNATELAARDGRLSDAALMLGFVDHCFDDWADGRQPTEAVQRERIEAILSARLEPESYAALWERGRSLSLFEADVLAGFER
ncbi:winged helix-turn-helix domain-containing protein [Mesorhizobium sp. VK23B]|uniref:Winged helix-turn-helix domain-containing protein n=1 Tax=Mesorhizobium dulcispinae TaxID=3072316 RepID=A0ABU4X6T5_9HYPH|nr:MULTISPECIES: winged helix-turn-helix domain-containing protein [unclassified Mesorhizobium]MDX8464135.1 winged helix-turn-helix domain-containing protein [Mesorhizobium sp. VK23B]MDX8470521.1 winged helix-turn-helix domain-containing protein [Mesorhizobium sp. VK23A]